MVFSLFSDALGHRREKKNKKQQKGTNALLAPVLFLLFSLSLSLVSCQSAELTELGKGDYNIETPLTHTGQQEEEEEELHIAPGDKREKRKKEFPV